MLLQLFILGKIEIVIYHDNLAYFNYFLVENENNKFFEPCIYTLNLQNANPFDHFLIFSMRHQKVLIADKYQLLLKLQQFNFKIETEEDIKKALRSIAILNENYIFHTLPSSFNTKTIPFSKFLRIFFCITN